MKQIENGKEFNFTNIRSFIDHLVAEYGEKDAMIYKDKNKKVVRHSFVKLKHDIDAVSAFFIKKKLKGKHIAVIGKNSYEWLLTYFATINNVGVLVPLDRALPQEEIVNLIEIGDVDAIVYDPSYEEIIQNIIDEGGNLKKEFAISMDEISQDKIDELYEMLPSYKSEFKDIKDKETTIIIFTSGTTSVAKAAELSHFNIASNVSALHKIEPLTSDDVGLLFLPLHHAFGSTGASFILSYGGACAFSDGLKYFQQELKQFKVSTFFCVPLILDRMLEKALKTARNQGKLEKLEKARKISKFFLKFGIDLRPILFKEVRNALGGSLKLLISGAAPINPETLEYFNDFGIYAIQGYGLTECSPVISGEEMLNRRPGSVGRPLPGVSVKINQPDEDGIGEIYVKGPNVMKGYYKNDEVNRQVFVDGWYNTGDLGYLDKDNFIYISGRKKNVIVCKNGKNIYPEEIEILIDRIPGVLENVVSGVKKDDDYKIVATLVYDEEYFDSEDKARSVLENAVEEVNDRLPKYKRIKEVIVRTEPFEKTTTNKIKR